MLSAPHLPRRRWAAPVAVVGLCGLLASCGTPPQGGAAPAATVVQQGLEGLVQDDAFPAALAHVRTANGEVENYTAGVGDRASGAAVTGRSAGSQ